MRRVLIGILVVASVAASVSAFDRGVRTPSDSYDRTDPAMPSAEQIEREAAAAARIVEAQEIRRPGSAEGTFVPRSVLDRGPRGYDLMRDATGALVIPSGMTATSDDPDAAEEAAAETGDAQAAAAHTGDPGDAGDSETATAAATPQRPQTPVLSELDLGAFTIAERGEEDDALIVAFYGNPRSQVMGILGEYPLERMARKLMAVAKEYDDANGDQPVLPGFHIIYATVWENADVGILRDDVLQPYIDFAEEHGWVVFLDHQLGKHDVVESVESMLPFLQYESVHLAIDPEWSTLRPGQVIGSVTAEEINRSQQLIQDYLIEHDLPGNRMFVVHQFNWIMIENREDVRTDFERVRLVHNADGFGPPAAKIRSWEFNLLARNIPEKGFKLFYPKTWRNGGFDYPLMTVEEVMELDPRPAVIMYQ